MRDDHPQMGDGNESSENWQNEPAPECLRHPEDFPGPSLDVLLRRITICREYGSCGVKSDALRKTWSDHAMYRVIAIYRYLVEPAN